jgi:gamma-glutamyltranspeptidase/glutathione hydrolase
MQALAERFATRPWDSFFQPAIAAAENGFPMYSFLYGEMASAWERISHHPSGRAQYTPDGFIPPVGQTMRQPKLAEALRRIAQPDGVEWFQRGEFARNFVKAVRDTGGTITEDELAAYEARWDEPLAFRAFDHDMIGGPSPEYGAAYSAVGLGILERSGFDASTRWWDSADKLALVARALAVSETYVWRYLLDPTAFNVPLDVLLSDEFLSIQARLLTASTPKADLSPAQSDSRTPEQNISKTDSNHLTIVDAQGNWLTMLHTVFGTPFGTGLVVDGISVNSGNIMYFPGPAHGTGKRISTPLPPVMVMREGRPWLALGSPGASCHAVALILLNVLHEGLGLQEAIDAPRVQLRPGMGGNGWRIGQLSVETRLPEGTMDGLKRLGIDLHPLGDYNWHMGSIQAVMRDGAELLGAADPRRAGYAEGF